MLFVQIIAMKKLLYILAFLSLTLFGRVSMAQVPVQMSITYQTFYNELQSYGNWISYPGYGFVWQPALGNSFRPYETQGHWVATVDGWAWASDYSWGWAPFHYGRWLLDPALGWVWVPGYEWAPAWVQWGRRSNYYGWAPLSPGVSIGSAYNYIAPAGYWSFIPYNCISRSNIHRYIVRSNGNNITVINNYNSYNNSVYYHRGPQYNEVEQYTHKSIRPLAIAPTTRPGRAKVDNKLEIYRPHVTANESPAIAPQKVKTFEQVKTDRQSAGIKILPNNVKPTKGGTMIQEGDNVVIRPNAIKSTGQRPAGSSTTIQNNNAATNPRANQPGLMPKKVIKSEAEENAPTTKPMNTGGIKPPPASRNIELTLPEPKASDQFQHREGINDRALNQPAYQNPTPKPQVPVNPVQQPVIRQMNSGGIKPPPAKGNIETSLPVPKAYDQYRHREGITDKPVNKPIYQNPNPKNERQINAVQQPQIKLPAPVIKNRLAPKL